MNGKPKMVLLDRKRVGTGDYIILPSGTELPEARVEGLRGDGGLQVVIRLVVPRNEIPSARGYRTV